MTPERRILDTLKFGVILINFDLLIIEANQKAVSQFGNIVGRYLYDLEKSISKPNLISRLEEVLETGEMASLIITKSITNHKSNILHVSIIPTEDYLKSKEAIVLISDDNDINRWQKDYNILLESIPVFISIVDKDLRVVRANQKYRDTFSSFYSIFYVEPAKRKNDYQTSPTMLTFEDGEEHTGTHTVFSSEGDKLHLIATTVPYSSTDGAVSLVMEILHDITELNKLQDQLHHTHEFYNDLVESSVDGIIAIDNNNRVQILNDSFKRMMKWTGARKPNLTKIEDLLPKEFFNEADKSGIIVNNSDSVISTTTNEKIPVKLNAFEIRSKKKTVGRVAFIQDLRKIKRLESLKDYAEKEALKTTVYTIEGGINKILDEQDKVLKRFNKLLHDNLDHEYKMEAWKNVKFHYNYINDVIRSFIDIAKGYKPVYQTFNLRQYAESIINQFTDIAKFYNVKLTTEFRVRPGIAEYDSYLYTKILEILIMSCIENTKELDDGAEVYIRIEDIVSKPIIVVSDNGPDFEELLNKKTLKFKDPSKMRIGLITLNLLVEANEGVFEIMSDKINGNVYRVLLS